MLGLKGWRRASQYLRTMAMVGHPVKVSMKLEDSGLHHLLARMVSFSEVSSSC